MEKSRLRVAQAVPLRQTSIYKTAAVAAASCCAPPVELKLVAHPTRTEGAQDLPAEGSAAGRRHCTASLGFPCGRVPLADGRSELLPPRPVLGQRLAVVVVARAFTVPAAAQAACIPLLAAPPRAAAPAVAGVGVGVGGVGGATPGGRWGSAAAERTVHGCLPGVCVCAERSAGRTEGSFPIHARHTRHMRSLILQEPDTTAIESCRPWPAAPPSLEAWHFREEVAQAAIWKALGGPWLGKLAGGGVKLAAAAAGAPATCRQPCLG